MTTRAFLGVLGPPWLPEAPGLCVFVCVFVENGPPKTWGNRKCGLRTRVPVLRTRVPNFGYMDGGNTEIPGLSRLDLIFSKFSLSSNLRQLRVHIEGLSDTQGHRRARPLGAVRGPSMAVRPLLRYDPGGGKPTAGDR